MKRLNKEYLKCYPNIRIQFCLKNKKIELKYLENLICIQSHIHTFNQNK